MTDSNVTGLRRLWLWAASCLVLISLAGCAGNTAHRQGLEMLQQGNLEDAVGRLEQASREAPDNREFRIHYLNAQAQAINQLLAEAQQAREAGRFDAAELLYRRILKLERGHAQSLAGLVEVEQERRHARLLAEAHDLLARDDRAGAELKLNQLQQENPRQPEAIRLRRKINELAMRNEVVPPALHRSFQKRVTLEFRDTELKQVLEVLSRHAGLNFVLDKDVPPSLTVTVFLRQVSVEEALDVMLTTHQLRRRVLNDSTLLIYPDTVAKQDEHQELIVKNFFLANTEAKQAMTMLKTMLKAKNVFADDKLNLLIVRDTPAMIRLVERMISIQDVSEPEVMLELEVLEVQRSRLLNLGINFPNQLSLSPLPSTGTVLTLNDLRNINSSRIGAVLPSTVINLQRLVSDGNLLANPRIRTHNREKALIKIGDRVPVITTTSTPTGFVSENVQYVDVGLKLEVEPTIFPNDEISIKLALEVSSVTKEIVSSSGTVSYQISGRNASTVLRLKDGETQILGGLINDQDISTANRFPGLGDLPILGRLFSSQRDSHDKTELILSVTPRLVRGLAPPPDVPGEFWSGTELAPRLNGATLSRPAPEQPPASTSATRGSGAAAPLPATTDPAATVLYWEGPALVTAGSTFKLVLKASSPREVASFPLQVSYDANVFELVDATPGRFMTQGDALLETIQRTEAAAGMLFLTLQRSGLTGARGEGELLEVRFRALKPVANSLITLLPTLPQGPDRQELGQAGPAVFSVGVMP